MPCDAPVISATRPSSFIAAPYVLAFSAWDLGREDWLESSIQRAAGGSEDYKRAAVWQEAALLDRLIRRAS
jgi:hypothetical protein